MLLQNNRMIFDLEKALTLKTQIENRNISQANRFRLSIMEKELMDKSLSVILVFKITAKHALLQYCSPLTVAQYAVLEGSGYVPILRSGKYLKIGLDRFMGNHYAYAKIQFPLDSDALDFMTAFDYIQKELETYLNVLNINTEE